MYNFLETVLREYYDLELDRVIMTGIHGIGKRSRHDLDVLDIDNQGKRTPGDTFTRNDELFGKVQFYVNSDGDWKLSLDEDGIPIQRNLPVGSSV